MTPLPPSPSPATCACLPLGPVHFSEQVLHHGLEHSSRLHDCPSDYEDLGLHFYLKGIQSISGRKGVSRLVQFPRRPGCRTRPKSPAPNCTCYSISPCAVVGHCWPTWPPQITSGRDMSAATCCRRARDTSLASHVPPRVAHHAQLQENMVKQRLCLVSTLQPSKRAMHHAACLYIYALCILAPGRRALKLSVVDIVCILLVAGGRPTRGRLHSHHGFSVWQSRVRRHRHSGIVMLR